MHYHRRVSRDSSSYHDHASIRHGMGGSRQLGVQIDSNTAQLGRRGHTVEPVFGSGVSLMLSDHGLFSWSRGT